MTEEELVRRVTERLRRRVENPMAVEALSVSDLCAVTAGLPQTPRAREIWQALWEGRTVTIPAEGMESRRLPPEMTEGMRRLIRGKERRLIELGVKIEEPKRGGAHTLITLARAQALWQAGEKLPQDAIVTPSARDYWREQEGAGCGWDE